GHRSDRSPCPLAQPHRGHREEAPDQLLANPKNWRIHPASQQGALASVLDDVGWVGQVLVNRRTGHLVDGHLRVVDPSQRAASHATRSRWP
nr:hypothetical protein [Chloroflexota bacterium]